MIGVERVDSRSRIKAMKKRTESGVAGDTMMAPPLNVLRGE